MLWKNWISVISSEIFAPQTCIQISTYNLVRDIEKTKPVNVLYKLVEDNLIAPVKTHLHVDTRGIPRVAEYLRTQAFRVQAIRIRTPKIIDKGIISKIHRHSIIRTT